MSRWILARSQPRPKACGMCGEFFMVARDSIAIPWVIEGEPRWQGRILWYFHVCFTCFRTLPEKLRARAIEPARWEAEIVKRDRRARWHATLPVSPPPAGGRLLPPSTARSFAYDAFLTHVARESVDAHPEH